MQGEIRQGNPTTTRPTVSRGLQQNQAPPDDEIAHSIDELAIDELAIDELAIDELAIDELAIGELAIGELAPPHSTLR